MVYDTLNSEVLYLILKDIKEGERVLDIGCGTGRLGKELKASVNCYVAGIDIDRDALSIAKAVYDETMLMDIEKLKDKSVEFIAKEIFDYIIFGDSLEHTLEPEFMLKYFKNFLKDGGFIIVSLPNIANWMIRIKLLFGNFDYDQGILSESHRRFFTYKTARKLLEDNGYRIISVRNNNTTRLIRFLGRIWIKMFAFQFVFKCAKN